MTMTCTGPAFRRRRRAQCSKRSPSACVIGPHGGAAVAGRADPASLPVAHPRTRHLHHAVAIPVSTAWAWRCRSRTSTAAAGADGHRRFPAAGDPGVSTSPPQPRFFLTFSAIFWITLPGSSRDCISATVATRSGWQAWPPSPDLYHSPTGGWPHRCGQRDAGGNGSCHHDLRPEAPAIADAGADQCGGDRFCWFMGVTLGLSSSNLPARAAQFHAGHHGHHCPRARTAAGHHAS